MGDRSASAAEQTARVGFLGLEGFEEVQEL